MGATLNKITFDKRHKPKTYLVIISLIITAMLWFSAFVTRPFNFWIMMSINTSVLGILAVSFYGSELLSKEDFNKKNFFLGFISALVLYCIFWVGNQLMLSVGPSVGLSDKIWNGGLEQIYANRGAISPWVLTIILIFPIGSCEELFWRGAIQRYFMTQNGPIKGFLVTTVLYTLVHLPTGNLTLLLAAIVCGIFWGLVYLRTKSLAVVLISHAVWDPLIFAIMPIMPI